MNTLRDNFKVTSYLVIGPENTMGRNLGDIVRMALSVGFTFVQIRSKVASARELIEYCRQCANIIADLKLENTVPLVVDDRLDVVLAARCQGIKVDGIHVGQGDVPVDVCRKYLGEDSIVGLSAPNKMLIEYLRSGNLEGVDYLGAGPLHETQSKTDLETDKEGRVIYKSLDEITMLTSLSKVPVVVGGGVTYKDLYDLKHHGAAGFFVISAVTLAEDPKAAAQILCDTWKNA
jgi:thiamine-phosphate diphosphorylase